MTTQTIQAPTDLGVNIRRREKTTSFTRLYIITMIVLTVAFVGGLWLFTWLAFDDPATGLGVGVMSAFWGAPGFGIMIAGAIWSGRTNQH